jgi:lysophospholipase L1-like esterase
VLMSRRRSLRVTILAGGFAAGSLLLTTTSAAAGARVTHASRYLALGDSVAFGYEESSVVPAPNYANAASFRAYPEQLGSRLRLKVANAACPGETSASFINPAAQSLGCRSLPGGRPGYRTVYPLHLRYTGSPLRYAIRYLRKHRRTRLVSLTVGANDVFLCQRSTPDFCTSVSERAAVFAKIRRNVRRILRAIRRKARYGGQPDDRGLLLARLLGARRERRIEGHQSRVAVGGQAVPLPFRRRLRGAPAGSSALGRQ